MCGGPDILHRLNRPVSLLGRRWGSDRASAADKVVAFRSDDMGQLLEHDLTGAVREHPRDIGNLSTMSPVPSRILRLSDLFSDLGCTDKNISSRAATAPG